MNKSANKNNYAVKVENLSKEFIFHIKENNKGFFANLFKPDKKKVTAVNKISFQIKKGERIAFIGPNGAGKSTTIKMLTGILFPTNGKIEVLGINPVEERKRLAYKIGTVFGQRSQLFPNLPLVESLHFFGVMYGLNNKQISKRINELIEIFDLVSFKDQPVRKLSLGQRMRAEVACALIHKPEIIFLDEPTIGLDVISKKVLRELLVKLNEEEGTTIFLTSHDVGDIESLCQRTIIVNNGEIVKDMETNELTKTFVHEKYIDLILDKVSEVESDSNNLPQGIKLKDKSEIKKVSFIINLKEIDLKDAIKKLLDLYNVQDIDVYDVDLETVIREIYSNKN